MPLLYRRLFTRSSNHLFFPKCPHSQASSLNPLRLLHHTHHQRLLLLLPKPLSGPLLSPGTSHDFLSVKPFLLFREVHLALRGYKVVRDPLALLRSKLEEEGILCGEMKLGLSMRELCPQCKGGNSMENSLSILIQENGELALWICFRATCGWRGYINASGKGNNYCPINPISKVKKRRNLSEEDLCLEPLCNELLAYFSARMISEETLRRNAVLQRNWDDRIAIAFPYRQDGKVVSCKYRDITKKIWQEKDTEKIFYGVDDIKEASDILIVEGEIDKLSMEEAGFCNCVSVPDGAPVEISDKVLPSEDKFFQDQ